jgi:hypothetical protein
MLYCWIFPLSPRSILVLPLFMEHVLLVVVFVGTLPYLPREELAQSHVYHAYEGKALFSHFVFN